MTESHLDSSVTGPRASLESVRATLPDPVPFLLLPVALVLWFTSLQSVSLQAMTDLGLASVLPPAFFASVILVSVSYAVSLYRRQPAPVLVLHLAALILMLFGVAPLLQDLPRTAIAWKMVGIMDYVARNGAVDPTLDAFHNWPGFFILGAFISRAMGLDNALPLATWAPVFFNILYLAPLYLLFSSATGDERVKWLGIWFFYLANWIGQDYLAPQAFGFAIYLTTLAILMRWFRAPDSPVLVAGLKRLANGAARLQQWLLDDAPRPAPSTPRQRLLLMGTVIFLFAVLVPSHQLTPVAIVAAITALVLVGRITPRSLPLLFLVLIGIWLSYMTVPYLKGHIAGLVEPLGDLGSNVEDNVFRRLRGSPEHLLVVRLRIAVTLLLWGVAFLGFVRRQRNGYRDIDFALLALAPLGLLGLQTYGGELALRVYLFALPFMAFFVATLFYPLRQAGRTASTPLLTIFLSVVFIGAFFVTRYGNERMDYFTEAEIEAIETLYDMAPEGALLASATDFLPWRHRDYEEYRYVSVERQIRDGDYEDLDDVMRSREESYLILTRSQKASIQLFWGWPEGQWDDTFWALSENGNYELVYINGDAAIFRFAGEPLAETGGQP